MNKCFLVEATSEAFVSLRRYSSSAKHLCTNGSYHNAEFPMGKRKIVFTAEGYSNGVEEFDVPHSDPRWPTQCECGYTFADTDPYQHFHKRVYTDGIGEWSTRDMPPGAMYYADWLTENIYWDNPSGRMNLIVITPGGEWNIDSRASNCTLPNDRLHRCWVRHGEAPMLTVDKDGHTCAAGAGSIISGDYHGLLQNGCLT